MIRRGLIGGGIVGLFAVVSAFNTGGVRNAVITGVWVVVALAIVLTVGLLANRERPIGLS